MSDDDLLVFGPGAEPDYAHRVADRLGIPLAPHEEREFEDGEHKIRPLCSVRGRDVYVVQTLHGDASQALNDKLIRLLFFLAALRDAQARRVTAVIPYLPYARKDRRTKPRDPVTTRYLAQLIETAGADRVLAMDVHNPAAFENAFRIPVDHLEARPLFVEALLEAAAGEPVTVVSPDAGGYKRAERLRETLTERLGEAPPIAFMEKKRSEGVVSGEALVGEVAGRVALVVDDLVASGGTLARSAAACRQAGARRVYAAATHGLFTGDAETTLASSELAGLWVTDTVPAFRLGDDVRQRLLSVLDSTRLVAEAVRRLHEDGSLVALQDEG